MKNGLLSRLLEIGGEKCVCVGKASDDRVLQIESELGVKLPNSYIAFLKECGHAVLPGYIILGNGLALIPSCVRATMEWRSFGLPNPYLVIEESGLDWIFCLDTSQIEEEECPVLLWEKGMDCGEKWYKSFYDYIEDIISDLENRTTQLEE